MPGSSNSVVVVLALLLLPAGVRGQNYCNGDNRCDSRTCNGGFIDPDGALVIPGEWTTVPDNAFDSCPALASVSFSNSSVTTLGVGAFANCTALELVSFSNSSVTTLGTAAFRGCSALDRKSVV